MQDGGPTRIRVELRIVRRVDGQALRFSGDRQRRRSGEGQHQVNLVGGVISASAREEVFVVSGDCIQAGDFTSYGDGPAGRGQQVGHEHRVQGDQILVTFIRKAKSSFPENVSAPEVSVNG